MLYSFMTKSIIIYLKEFIASDWLTAMCEIVMSNEWRHNVRYEFICPRHDVITLTKKSYVTLWPYSYDDDINLEWSKNVKQHNLLH